MKKLINKCTAFLLFFVILVTTGCGEDQAGNNSGSNKPALSEPTGEHIPFFKYTYDNCGYGMQSEFFDVNIVIYEDCTVSVYTDNAVVCDDRSEIVLEKEYTISQEQFDEIYEEVKDSKLYQKKKVRENTAVCDGGDSYMTFYSNGEEIVTLGGYCVSDRKFCKLETEFFDTLALRDEILEIREETEEVLSALE